MFTIPMWIKSVAKNIAADQKARPILAGVQITKDGRAQATNSFVAISIPLAKGSHAETKQFSHEKYPQVGAKPLASVPPSGLMLPSDLIRSIRFPRFKDAEVIHGRVVLCEAPEGKVSIGSTDLQRSEVTTQATISGSFPDIDTFARSAIKRKTSGQVRVNARYMIRVLETMEAAGYTDVSIRLGSEDEMVFVDSGTSKTDISLSEAYGLVMPLRW